MYRIKRLLPCLLAVLLLTACGTSSGGADTTTPQTNDGHNDPVQLTEVRTPTPTLPAGESVTTTPDRSDGTNGNQSGNQGAEQDEMGAGAELEGYYQLLTYIDQSSISGPGGWTRHEVDDMLDGLFETTDNGSNKYGQNLSSVDVTWKMTRSVKISAYAIYTANDTEEYPERNPKSWTLYGSTDGENWKAIHSVEDAQLPVANYTPTLFEFENNRSYQYYRWSLESTVEGGVFQLSELLLYTQEELTESGTDGEGGSSLPSYLPAYGAAETGVSASPLTGTQAQEWMDDHVLLTDLVDVGGIVSSLTGYQASENAEHLFDGVYTAGKFEEKGYGKMCGPAQQAYVYWEMTQAVTPTGYVLVTGNDTAEYPDRNPVSWVLYGATENGSWVALDAVKEGNMLAADFAAHVFPLENAEAYTRFCLMIERTSGVIQLCELILCQ